MGLFSRTTPKQKLQKKYDKLIEEAYKLSTTNRRASDAKQAEADAVLKELEKMD